MPKNLNLDYYYSTMADQYSFYRTPKTVPEAEASQPPEAREMNDSSTPAPPVSRPKSQMRMDEMDRYRDRIKENIDFNLFLTKHPYDEETLEGYVEAYGGGLLFPARLHPLGVT